MNWRFGKDQICFNIVFFCNLRYIYSSGNPLQEINHHITPVIEVDRPNKEIHEISHKIDIVDRIAKITKIEITIHDRIQTQQNLFLHPVPT